MKKTIAIIGILFFVMFSTAAFSATEWHTANSTKVGWDAVTKSEDGTVTFGAGEITYNVYLANSVTDPQKTSPVKAGTSSTTNYVVTLNVEGRYIPGVSAVRTVGGVVIGESTIAWADAVANPWGIQFYVIPPPPSGVRPE